MNEFDEIGDLIEEEPEDEEIEFYSLDRIKALNCHYNLIFGKRSNGKTYSVLLESLINYIKHGKQSAYVRRYREDFVGKRGATLFAALVSDGTVSRLSDGKWNGVKYQSSQWFLTKTDAESGKEIRDSVPFCYGFSLASMEHDKSTSYPDVTTIIFDEFISRIGYLKDEFVLFMNVISTIARQRDDLKIYMLGNTVNKYCPYFAEMGLGHIENMESGKIDVYTYGNSKLRVAVERTKNHNIGGRKSEVYFAFDNPALSMITGGVWELNLYPHLPREYKEEDVVFKFFVLFNDQMLQGNIIVLEDCSFIFMHRKSSKLRHPDEDLIFSEEYDPRPNHVRNMRKSTLKVCRKIGEYFVNNKVFYHDNDVGEIMRNYLQFCKTDVI